MSFQRRQQWNNDDDEESPRISREVDDDEKPSHQFRGNHNKIVAVGLGLVMGFLFLTSFIPGNGRVLATSSPEVIQRVSPSLDDDFAFCTQSSIGGLNEEDSHETMDIWYQCEGTEYEEFGKELRKFAGDYASHRTPSWGHRRHALPANSKVLLFGNSHTRQIGQTLACQYAKDIVGLQYLDAKDKPDPNMAIVVEFRNGAQLYLVTNSYVAHSPHWRRLLEDQIRMSLSDFDAIILGLFNPGSKHMETDFVQNMIHLQKVLPASAEFSVQDNYGPSVREVANEFAGPIQFVTLFGSLEPARTKWASEQVIELARNQDPRDNVEFLDSRLYIEGLGMEGASEDRTEKSTVSHNNVQAHRCTGSLGGHADLVTWDVTEFLYHHIGGRSQTMH